MLTAPLTLTPPKPPPQAVTKAKLGYDPVEVAPEDMVRMAAEQPQVGAGCVEGEMLAQRSVWLSFPPSCATSSLEKLLPYQSPAAANSLLHHSLSKSKLGFALAARRPWPPTLCPMPCPPTTCT